ncbi:MAG: DUF362 domain-containing protein [Spirochaetales bacterium]|nr:DUF362 domain-containing protein [Spirochaetales bacterium]
MAYKVFIVKCPDYEHSDEMMKVLFSMMGDIKQFVHPGEKVLIKPNLLSAADPEKAVTTHPRILAGVCKFVEQGGGAVLIADSPGSGIPYNRKSLEKCYERCGIYDIALKNSWELNYNTEYKQVSFQEGSLIKQFEIIAPVLDADVLFNVCKLKTHVFMHLTGAVKNMFGVIPGLKKPGYHSKLRNKGYFARMLIDLIRCIPPRLSIMDAVVGMEGNGPSGGTPKNIGYLLASENPLALDIIAGEIAGLSPKDNPVLTEARRLGITPNSPEQVELIGADFSEIRCRDFKLPDTLLKGGGLKLVDRLSPLFVNVFTRKPHIRKDICIACGACKRACPESAITIINSAGEDAAYAEINHKKCIRCYCCHEMCPENAVQLTGGLLYRMFSG